MQSSAFRCNTSRNGRRAAWVEGYVLVGEAKITGYRLGGPNLSLDETIRIAESLE